MDELIAFIGGYDPGHPKTLQGAAWDRIARLTDLVGRELPPIHTEFLRSMGASMGSMEVPDLSFDIEQVIETYESQTWRPPSRYILVALEMKDPYFDYYLDLESPAGPDFGVVRFETGGKAAFEGRVHPSYHSFRDMLFSLGFFLKRLKPLPVQTPLVASPTKHGASKSPPGEQLALVEQLALKLGFKRVGATGPGCLLLDREDAALYGHLPPRGGLSVQAAGTEAGRVAQVCEVLRDHTLLV
jgi:hypothetical protein